MATRRSELEGHTIDTACPLDCPDSCSLSVTVNHGRIAQIEGSHRQDTTAGFICAKVRQFDRRVYGADRLRYPAIRTGAKGSGTFARISWDEALDLVASRIDQVRQRWGGEAILPFSYGGSNGLLSQDTTDAALFRRLGTSQLARTVCAAPSGAAAQGLYGKMPGVTYADYRHSRLIVIWGANPSVSGIHLVPNVLQAQREGATLVVIDPRRTPLARLADLHLPVKPGTDLAVALAVHNALFEQGHADEAFLAAHSSGAETLRERAAAWPIARAAQEAGLAPEALARFVDLYAATSPAVIRCGWGLERNRNGGSAVMAILALPAVAGKFGVRGGGYSMSNSGAWRLTGDWVGVAQPSTRRINMNHLGRALTEFDDPPVQLLFVYNCNPVATMPDQNRVLRGLQRDDLFTVVFEQTHTDTARLADLILPATTFLETYDVVKSYGPISMQLANPVIEPVADARPNVEVFAEIARRLALTPEPEVESDAEALLRVAGALPDRVGHALLEHGTAPPPMGAAPVQFVDVFPNTPDAKVHLVPAALEREAAHGVYAYQPDGETAAYPLSLISPASGKTISSTLGELDPRIARAQIHPADATARQVADGDTVRLFNDLGEVHCLAAVTDEVRPGTVSLPKGLWRRQSLNESTANALVPDSLSDLAGGACFNDARIEVERVITADLEGRSVALATPPKPRIH